MINANQVLSKSDSEELHVGVSAAFIDSNNHQITFVRTLSVNDQIIQPGQDSMYNYNYASDQISKSSQLFGTQILVTIHGMDEADTVSSSVYLPKQLSPSLENYPDTVSVSHGLPVTMVTRCR